jgi:hypothetical protein
MATAPCLSRACTAAMNCPEAGQVSITVELLQNRTLRAARASQGDMPCAERARALRREMRRTTWHLPR